MGADNWEPKSNNISKSTTFKPVKAWYICKNNTYTKV
jgi:hypothetical protein